MNPDVINRIHEDLKISVAGIEAAVALLTDGASVPFIARYRKDATGSLDDARIREIGTRYKEYQELDRRRQLILNRLTNKGCLSDELREKIEKASVAAELEDLYLPFRPKRRSRAHAARALGLEPLADYIEAQSGSPSPEEAALGFLSLEKGVSRVQTAISGALDILAERIAETAELRKWLRDLMIEKGVVHARVAKGREGQKTKYSTYYDFTEPAARIPSHRFLAVRRGTREKILSYSVEVDTDLTHREFLEKLNLRDDCPWKPLLEQASNDAYTRLLEPAIHNEVRAFLRARAEAEAIRVFQENLWALLVAPPAGQLAVAGIAAHRTGCRLAVVDPTGHFVQAETFLAKEPARNGEAGQTEPASGETGSSVPRNAEASLTEPASEAGQTELIPGGKAGGPDPVNRGEVLRNTLLPLIKKYGIRGVAIGSGAGATEAETLIRSLIADEKLDVFVIAVNDAGASAYSASPVSKAEFPELDAATRSAISIARRLQDPLRELVKIDPKTIGVGQYQHDVNQNRLRAALATTVEAAVSHVGVDLNTASVELLGYVSGISPGIARAIVAHRNARGPFRDRRELLEVPGFDDKTFEQAAGFLRVEAGNQPLDRTHIHPESYPVLDRMAESVGVSLGELLGNDSHVGKIPFGEFEKDLGRFALADIRQELLAPGRDLRRKFVPPRFRPDVREIGDLKTGMELEGQVTNVTNFGAFVDVGVHQDGLIHISELSHQYVSDARRAVGVGDRVRVRVIEVDPEMKRISLSRKVLLPKPQTRSRPRPAGAKPEGGEKGRTRPRRPGRKPAADEKASSAPRAKSRRPRKPPQPQGPPMSMEEKIRQLQEKFRGPSRKDKKDQKDRK